MRTENRTPRWNLLNYYDILGIERGVKWIFVTFYIILTDKPPKIHMQYDNFEMNDIFFNREHNQMSSPNRSANFNIRKKNEINDSVNHIIHIDTNLPKYVYENTNWAPSLYKAM